MRYAARIDPLQPEIVAALRQIGATVWVIGLPLDLLVGYRGTTHLIEVKTLVGKRAPKPAQHTKLQQEFMRTWTGGAIFTVTDAESAIKAVTA